MSILDTRNSTLPFAGVFVQTNEQGTNRVLAFRRDEDGALEPAGAVPDRWCRPGREASGLAGIGEPHRGRSLPAGDQRRQR